MGEKNILLCLLVIIFITLNVISANDIEEDARLTTTELARKYGYPATEHLTTTSDGYILELHRIPGSPQSPPAPGKRVAFLMHGMLSSSGDWVLMGPNIGFAYLLADIGYDVWMGNARGNRYSRAHTHLNLQSEEFWNFSWHEIGTIDLPTTIDFILSFTGQQTLHYIGHSQGTTVFWVMCSELPQYNSRILSMHALAPAAFMHRARSPYIIWLSWFLTSTTIAFQMMGVHYFSPSADMNQNGGQDSCMTDTFSQLICANEIFLLAGWNLAELNMTELARKYGYPATEHLTTTSDGYILELHRIPGAPQSPPAPGKRVAFLMHGMLSSSGDWVLMGPNIGLAYMLADEGYDVWMGNARGNRYSRGHTHLSNQTEAYWRFSWHEIGTMDLPASIDFILAFTGQQTLHYIGHSQGTTVFWVMGSERPEYNSRILSMHALAPAAYMHRTRSPYAIWLSWFLTSTTVAFQMMGVHYFSPSADMNQQGGQDACMADTLSQMICANELFLMAGWNPFELNMTMLPVINGHSPAGSSSMQMIHFGQTIRSMLFRRYDFGTIGNMQEYGQAFPPLYWFTRVTAPVHMYSSVNDWLAPPEDVELLAWSLPNVRSRFIVPHILFNHLDFVWAINQRTLLHHRVLANMRGAE